MFGVEFETDVKSCEKNLELQFNNFSLIKTEIKAIIISEIQNFELLTMVLSLKRIGIILLCYSLNL